MTALDIVRAWKDAEYRQSLSAEEQTLLPEHPAGAIELPDEDLAQVAGGASTIVPGTMLCCTSHTLIDFTDCITFTPTLI
ncbi:MAG TPA: mersacidin/lichenicidin family type 2 lantibiotic [Ktedonobacterales bacterium]|jgi:mersacidin/lichenicidin family type 2 lantibiotic